MPPSVLNAAEVDALLRSSENRTTMYQGKGHDPEGRGHSLARHYLITNLGLVERRDTEPRNGKIAYFSAYITRADMVEAARELLEQSGRLLGARATVRRRRDCRPPARVAYGHARRHSFYRAHLSCPLRRSDWNHAGFLLPDDARPCR